MWHILLVDVDGVYPNLALMKLSSWHKLLGDKTYLLRLRKWHFRHYGKPDFLRVIPKRQKFDKVYISCIFSQYASLAKSIENMFFSLGVPVELGGSGVNFYKKLPFEIEHLKPDYDLYPDIHYSMGFTTRGCIRRCPWCIVWRKEGNIRHWADLEEFLDKRFDKVMLLDNNILAHKSWEETFLKLIRYRLKVCFNQGLDIRLVDDDVARLLTNIRYYDSDFNERRLYFAFDLPEIEESVVRGIKVLKRHGIPSHRLMFYMLVGYGVKPENYTWDYFLEHDYYRFQVLRKLRVKAFVMVYNDRRDIPLLKYFQRWVNRAYYKSWSLEKYLEYKHFKF